MQNHAVLLPIIFFITVFQSRIRSFVSLPILHIKIFYCIDEIDNSMHCFINWREIKILIKTLYLTAHQALCRSL